jgi:transcriptional regulator with XRE-family HTH domain
MDKKLQILFSPVAKKIKEARVLSGYNQQQMADLLAISQSQYSKYERGTQSISVCQLLQICKKLQIHPRYFFSDYPIIENNLKRDTSP